MSNEPRTAEPIPSERIAFVASELERFAEMLRLCEKTAKSQPNGKLSIYYWTSAETGLKRLASFVRSADESRRKAELGKPVEAGQLKPRSTTKPKSPSEVESIIEEHRQAVKKTKKKT